VGASTWCDDTFLATAAPASGARVFTVGGNGVARITGWRHTAERSMHTLKVGERSHALQAAVHLRLTRDA